MKLWLASVYKGYNITSVVDPDPYVFGPFKSGSLFCTDPDPYFLRIRILPTTSKKINKTLISTILWLLFDFLSMKTDVNVPSKSNKQKKLWKKKYFFVGILSATNENSRSRIRIRIRKSVVCIRTKMSRIHNTEHSFVTDGISLLGRLGFTGFRIRIRIGSGFNRASGSGFGIRIRIQEGRNDPQK